MGKRYIIALTQASVDLSLCPEATVADSISSSPPPFGQVVLPRFVKNVRENFPDFDVLSGCSKKDFECREEEVKMAEILFIVDAPSSLLAEVIPLAPNLKWIHSYLAGVEGLCAELRRLRLPSNPSVSLSESGILVTNARGVFSSSLKEYTMAAILHFAKQIPRLQANKQNRRWERFVMGEVKGQTVGFIGYGDIAKEIASACRAFNMRCIALRRDASRKCELLDAVYGSSSGSQALEVYRQSDFIVCSLPATEETRSCISYEQFAAMKKTAVFISIGRGSVVDEAALLHALNNKQIAGAALDVFQREPLPADSPLWGADNLLLSSHNADFSENFSAAETMRVFSNNMHKYLKGVSSNEDMATPVNCSRGY